MNVFWIFRRQDRIYNRPILLVYDNRDLAIDEANKHLMEIPTVSQIDVLIMDSGLIHVYGKNNKGETVATVELQPSVLNYVH